MTVLQRLATIYLTIILLAAAWVLYVDASMLHSVQERLLPSILLAALTLPSSLSIGLLFQHWPEFFSLPLAQLGWCVLCGALQAALLFLAGSHKRRKQSEA